MLDAFLRRARAAGLPRQPRTSRAAFHSNCLASAMRFTARFSSSAKLNGWPRRAARPVTPPSGSIPGLRCSAHGPTQCCVAVAVAVL